MRLFAHCSGLPPWIFRRGEPIRISCVAAISEIVDFVDAHRGFRVESRGNNNGLDMYRLGFTIVGAYDRDLVSGIIARLVLVIKIEGSL